MLALLYQLWIKGKIYISVTKYFQYEHVYPQEIVSVSFLSSHE